MGRKRFPAHSSSSRSTGCFVVRSELQKLNCPLMYVDLSSASRCTPLSFFWGGGERLSVKLLLRRCLFFGMLHRVVYKSWRFTADYCFHHQGALTSVTSLNLYQTATFGRSFSYSHNFMSVGAFEHRGWIPPEAWVCVCIYPPPPSLRSPGDVLCR